MNDSRNDVALRVSQPGAIDLKTLGHELVDVLVHAGGDYHRKPTWLRVDESGAVRSLVECPACGARANAGSFELEHEYRAGTLELPYLAAHVLAAHGVVELPGTRVDPEAPAKLRAFLNVPEQEVAWALLGDIAGAAPIPHVAFEHHEVKGVVACATCGDSINMGHVTFTSNGRSIDMPYLALHALAEHRDSRYAGGPVEGMVDLDAVYALLAGKDLVALGKRLAGVLELLEGHDLPKDLVVEEHPLRGLESCAQCSKHPNMGTFTLTREPLHISMTLPYIAVHALVEHQSAHYHGSLHDGWVDVPKLRRMLGDAPR